MSHEKSIHAHQILNMMAENNYTEESLVEAIHTQFGVEAIFHTCSAKGMNSTQIIEFFKNKGKFKPAPSGDFMRDKSAMCDHDHMDEA